MKEKSFLIFFYFLYLIIDSLAINSVSSRIDLGLDVGFDIFS